MTGMGTPYDSGVCKNTVALITFSLINSQL